MRVCYGDQACCVWYHKEMEALIHSVIWRFSLSREQFYVNSNINCIFFFLEWHFVLKALTTFTFTQPKKKHLWDVKIAFWDKPENEQEQKNPNYSAKHILVQHLKKCTITWNDNIPIEKHVFLSCDAMVRWKMVLFIYKSTLKVINEQFSSMATVHFIKFYF